MSARDFIEAAIRCQRLADLAHSLGRHRESRSYVRRRDYCARKAKELGGDPWTAILRGEA